MLDFDKTQYVGKKVQLYPDDPHYKEAVVESIDDLGWRFRITESLDNLYPNGTIYFVSHAERLNFVFWETEHKN